MAPRRVRSPRTTSVVIASLIVLVATSLVGPASSAGATTRRPARVAGGIHSAASAPASAGPQLAQPQTAPQLTIAQSDCVSTASTTAGLTAQFEKRGPVWGGGDGAQPIPIDAGRTLWLFGDTYIGGGSYGGALKTTGLVHNSMVVQYGGRCFAALLGHAGTTWSAAIPGPATNDWYWPNDGVYDANTGVLSIVASHVRKTTGGQWGWTVLGEDVLHFRVEPSISLIGVSNLFTYHTDDVAQFGASLLREGSDVYLYGCAQTGPSQCYVAKTDLALDASALVYETADGSWSADVGEAAAIDVEDFGGTELHVIKYGDGYLATSQLAVLSTATSGWWGPTPTGPFTSIGSVFDAGEPPLGPVPSNWFTYGGRLIATSAGTIGVYSVNTWDDEGATVAGVYGPRLVSVSHDVLDRDPFGNLESLESGPDSIDLSGWTIDPDTADPIPVSVWVDGSSVAVLTADGDRPDVGSAFPDYGPGHGFAASIAVAPGTHWVCVDAMNTGAGVDDHAFPCQSMTVGGNPYGNYESLTVGPDQVSLSGWVIDPDTAAPVRVDVWIDGHYAGTTVGGNERDDVGAAYPAYGSDHGFTVTLPLAGGTHSVCAYALNTGSGTGNRLLKCRTATVGGNPHGNFESATRAGNTVTLSGWALDPDTAGAILVHIYVDGRWTEALTADGSRPDIASAFPGWGAAHGFVGSVSVSGGAHSVCAYAINQGAGNSNVRLGCRSV